MVDDVEMQKNDVRLWVNYWGKGVDIGGGKKILGEGHFWGTTGA